ncbi:MAG: substrate-binding domain-containing protein [Bacteroidota bacterium]|nr:substrate-binding domain-containing protein [Bacteroidota bacterium]
MNISKFLSILILFSSLSSLNGCKPKIPRIGILIHDYDSDRWVKDKNYIVENLTKQGAEFLVETAGNDQKKQIEQARNMILNGAQVLIVVPVNKDEASKIVEMLPPDTIVHLI